MRREGDAQAGRDGLSVIVRDPGNNPIPRECGIHALVVARSDKQSKCSVITQAGVDRERGSDAPGVFAIKSQAPDALRKRPIERARRIHRRTIRIRIGRRAGGEHTRIRNVEARILRISKNGLRVASQFAAQDRLVDEVYPEPDGVAPHGS